MFPFQNKWNKVRLGIVTTGTRRYVSFSHQTVCLETNDIGISVKIWKCQNIGHVS